MNVKLIIVWVFAIIVFAIFGVFGLMNQDLLVKKDPIKEEYVPIVNQDVVIHTCKKDTEKGEITYKFNVKENKVIKQTAIFTARNVTVNDYISASNINNLSVNGANMNLQNGAQDFILTIMMDYNIASYDFTNVQNDLNNLGLNLARIDSYNDTVASLGSSVTCE